MNVISTIISEKLIHSFGWTIIHSIWQGAAAALGFALLMVLMRRCSSRTRYFAGIMALLLVLAMAAVTFTAVYNSYETSAASLSNKAAAANAAEPAETATFASTGAVFKNYFNRHLPLVVTVWFLGILVLVLRFAGGFLYNQRLKVHHTRPLPEPWQNRLKALCRKTKIRQSIRLVESALVKVPLAIGHIKPVILFPVGMVTGLPRDQVEALLAHELAHILRKDYLVNIMQNVVDILFFHHPGVRWMSSFVRTERENCCDDIAAALSGDSMNVAKALTNIQGYQMPRTAPAMAAAGKTSSLFNRVKRLADPPRRISEFSEGFIGAFILVVCLFSLVMISNAAARMSPNNAIPAPENSAVTAELSPAASAIADDEKEEEKKKRELEFKMQQEMKKAQQEIMKSREEEEKKLQLMEKEMQLKKLELQKKKEELRKQEIEMKKQEMKLEKKEKEELKNLHRELEIREKELLRKQKEMKIKQKTLQFEIQQKLKQAEKEMALKTREMKEKQKQLKIRQEELKKQQVVYETLAKNMDKDKLINISGDYEFKLSNTELVINGVKQPGNIFKKYMKLYESLTGKKLEKAIKILYSKDRTRIGH